VFGAHGRYERLFWRLWRRVVLVAVLRRGHYRFIVPPREWSQERADWAIARGRELAAEHGWDRVTP